MTPVEALQKAVNMIGGQTELANKIGAKQQNVWCWINRDKKASSRYVVKISEVTGIPCHELRPDIFPTPANDATNSPNIA